MNDLISRQAVLDKAYAYGNGLEPEGFCVEVEDIQALPSVDPEQRWIPVSERLPEDLQEVNVTWVNRNPASYYSHIKDVPFTATAVFYGGNWYWYTAQVTDYLGEYGECDTELISNNIEITAWKPLPEPYKEEEE